jgi:putative ABC transport system permease protein
VWHVVRQPLPALVAGLVAGLLAAVWAGRAIQAFLVGTESTDPVALAAGGVLFAAVTLAACVVPTRRVLARDPMLALRRDA